MDSKHAKPQCDRRYLEGCGDCRDCKKESSPPGTEQGARAMKRRSNNGSLSLRESHASQSQEEGRHSMEELRE
jgi:hypothetical protein